MRSKLNWAWMLAGAALCWQTSGFAITKEKIEAGLDSHEFAPNPKNPRQTLKVWTCRPESFGATSPIVFVMHGVKRNAEAYRDAWAEHSRRQGFLLVVPEFPEAQYPSESYQEGNILDRSGRPVDSSEWTFTAIERLFDHVKSATGNKSEKYYLYGHSAGGQFVHRFVLFMPTARYARAVAANPGFYTFPVQGAAYPYGLKGTHALFNQEVFARDFVLMLGEMDTDRNDPNLRKTQAADEQGLTRFQRGMTYFKTAKRVAEDGKAKFNWRLVTVPEVGHSDKGISAAAVRELFPK